MPFDGSGTYDPAPFPAFPAITGDVISSTYYNTVIRDIADALSNTITRDGQSTLLADLPLGGFRLKNLGLATAETDAVNVNLLKDCVFNVKLPPFNAKGDGVTNDTVAIQAAIAAAELYGYALYFPPGIYPTTKLTLTKPQRWFGSGAFSIGVGSGLGTIIRRIAGTDDDHIYVEDNAAFQEGTNYKASYFEVEGIAFDGQWGLNASGGGIVFADGTYGAPATTYGHSLLMKSCQVREYNSNCLYLGINRNAALVSNSILRWAFENVVLLQGSGGDHRFNMCDISGAKTGYSNIKGVSQFNCCFTDCNVYSSDEHGYEWDSSSSTLQIKGGQVNGNQKYGVKLTGGGTGSDYPVLVTGTVFEQNGLAANNTYADIYLDNRSNVSVVSNGFYGVGSNKPAYGVQVSGTARAKCLGNSIKSGAHVTGFSNDLYSGGADHVRQFSTTAAPGSGTTTYIGPFGQNGSADVTPFVASQTKQTVIGFEVALTAFPGSGQSVSFTLVKNGVDQLMTGTISGASTNTLVVATNPISLSQYDRYEIKAAFSGSAASAYVQGNIFIRDEAQA